MNETCDLCGDVFGSPASLLEHRARAHRNDDPAADLEANPEAHRPGLVCGMCGRRFSGPAALAEHNQRPHLPVRRYGRFGPVSG